MCLPRNQILIFRIPPVCKGGFLIEILMSVVIERVGYAMIDARPSEITIIRPKQYIAHKKE